MSILSQPINKLSVIAENIPFSSNWLADSNVQQSDAIPAALDHCIPPMRMEKVLAIRQQLAEGRYDLDKGLDVVVDRLLKALDT